MLEHFIERKPLIYEEWKSNQVNPSEENPPSDRIRKDLTKGQKIVILVVVLLLLGTSIVLSALFIRPNNVSILKSTTTTTAATTTTVAPNITLEGKSLN